MTWNGMYTDMDGKTKFYKQELEAISNMEVRSNSAKLVRAPIMFWLAAVRMAKIQSGGPGLSPAEDAQREKCWVLEVDDFVELLSRTPAEHEDGLGAAEPSVRDCLVSAFKWADFDLIDDDENPEEERTAISLVRAGIKSD